MTTFNRRMTLALALAAAVAWVLFSVVPGRFTLAYPEVQMPMAITLSAAACFGWFLVFLGERQRDDETRCRRCGHILRGLSAPRCPECGEAI